VGGRGGNALNRALDVAVAGAGLALASPVLAVAALAVKLGDGGPVLFKQVRVGKDGEDFELLKLRTMVVGAERKGAGYAVDRGDSRITRVGRLLRRTSLDELPQLWNVVRGDMSLIGPRPTLRYQVEKYSEHQRRRLDVLPGVTGWAQIHGRASLSWNERIELDVWYVEHRSPLTDVLILLRTPLALFGGTYKGETGGWSDIADVSRQVPDNERQQRQHEAVPDEQEGRL
jgi:lipopolysaccharide/colanic/teichoic acid biosynthesis glycosyltransferase